MLFFLHRRMKRNQKKEDNDAKHRSLDFGMDVGPGSGKKGNKVPEMTVTDLGDPMRSNRNVRGLSMDMDMSSPYLLPAGLNNSNASIHSMSRKISDEHDPYRPVTFIRSDADSMRSGRRMGDNGSIYSASTAGACNEKAGLIPNASRMSMSIPNVPNLPKRGESLSPTSPQDAKPFDENFQTRQMHSSSNRNIPPSSSRQSSLGSSDRLPLGSIVESAPRKDLPTPPEPVARSPPARTASAGPQQPPRKDSMPNAAPDVNINRASSNYGDDIRVTSATPESYDIVPQTITVNEKANVTVPTLHAPKPVNDQRASMVGNNRVSVIGLRPLPPNVPDDNPEQRANRIRSFYKEYFDDSKPQARAYNEEEYNFDYLRETAIYDPATNAFITGGHHHQGPAKPWAQPMTRRAMTPPPRGAPRNSGSSPRRGHNSTQSTGRPRLASASGHRGPSTPRKPMPPPAPLQSLPTPHKLGKDAHITNPIDFAPPSTFRDEQWGRRSDSPTGTPRPYSPSVAPHVPLAASYDDLAPIPSPYLLRQSGTFTSLDFAPPSKFKNEGGSDAGSIRSNRSGISAVQRDAVRAGAYRVSRIPTEVVDTRVNLQQQLKPSWDMREKGLLGVGGV